MAGGIFGGRTSNPISAAPVDATYVTTTASGILTSESLLSTVIGRGALGSRPAAGTAGRLYYDTTNSILYRDNGGSWESVEGAGGGGGGGGFDPLDSTTILLVDNFASGNTNSGQVGELGMVWSGSGGVAAVAAASGLAAGGFRGVTAATNPSAGAWTPRATPTTPLYLPNAQPWEIGWTVRPRLNAGVAASTTIRIGASSDPATTGTPSHGVYLEKAAADTNWFFTTRASSVETPRTDTGVAFVDDTVIRVRIRRTAIGANIGFSLNAATEINISTNLPTAGLMPGASIVTAETVAKHLEAFHFYFKLTELTGRGYV